MLSSLKLPLPKLASEEELIFELSLKFGEKLEAFANQIDREEEIPETIFKELSAGGFWGLGYREGSYVSDRALGLAILSVAYHCASTSIVLSVHNTLVGKLLELFATENQKKMWCSKLASGDWIGCFALSEAEAGSDIRNISTSYELTNEGFVLNGSKAWVTNAAYAKFVICFARHDKGVSAFGVELDNPGVTVLPPEKKLGIRGAKTNSIILDHVKVPSSSLIAQEGQGFKIALETLNYGRLGVACQSLGIGWRAFAEALKYSSMRKTFSARLIEHQIIQGYLSRMRTLLDHATCFTFHVLSSQSFSPRECSEAKLYSTEAASGVVDLALQIFGGNGYIYDFIIERLYRDVRVTRIYEGTTEMQLLTISKFLEKEFL